MRAERTTASRPGAAKTAGTHAADDDAGAAPLTKALDQEHAREVHEELLLARQRDRFDFAAEERSELEREYETMRDMMLEQMKNDDEVVKKYIAMI